MGVSAHITRNFQDQSFQSTHKTCASFSPNATIDYLNQRVIVNGYHIGDQQPFVEYLHMLANQVNLTKIIICTRESDLNLFLQHGFLVEAMNPYYFQGQPMYYLSKFLTEQRKQAQASIKKDNIVKVAQAKVNDQKQVDKYLKLPDNFVLRRATKKDIAQLIKLYQRVFSSYPTPIYSAAYLSEIMAEKTSHFVVITNQDKQIISAASADIDQVNLCAEVTDCATYPQYRGQKLMYHLVKNLEQVGQQKGLYSLYTLARAQSPGMNIVFSRNGYHYGGRLVHNCHICGSYEDMNLWTKKLKA